jgi:uncharacterized protein (TIGR00369 family)
MIMAPFDYLYTKYNIGPLLPSTNPKAASIAAMTDTQPHAASPSESDSRSALVPYKSTDGVLGRLGQMWRDTRHADLVLKMRVSREQLNPLGLLHGGVMLAAMDVLLVDAAQLADPQHRAFVTVSMSVEFMHAARSGDWLEYRPQVEKIGGSLAFMTGRILREDSSLTRVSAVLKALENARRTA